MDYVVANAQHYPKIIELLFLLQNLSNDLALDWQPNIMQVIIPIFQNSLKTQYKAFPKAANNCAVTLVLLRRRLISLHKPYTGRYAG
jgi:hypothetical protein